MRKIIYLAIVCISAFGCRQESTQEYSLQGINSIEPSVEFLNDNHYDLDVLSSGGFQLSIRVKDLDTNEYEINYSQFRITESATSLNQIVGGSSFDGKDFNPGNVLTKNFQIYRGGQFNIVAEVSLAKLINNTEKIVTSQPMTIKVLYPDANYIENQMNEKFRETWNEAKMDPNRYEYGYYVVLQNKKLIKGKLCKGQYNPCNSLIQTVHIEDNNETSPNENPTKLNASENRYSVALFHTHPSLHMCSSNVSRNPVGASSIDTGEPNANPYRPRFVFDYVQNIVGGHDVNAPAKVYCYANNRRDPF